MNRNAKLTERKLARALHLRAEWRVLPAAFLATLLALPVNAAISSVPTYSVQTTFFLFLAVFTILLIAGIGISLRIIRKGPEGMED